jgi:hypothetical protein
MTKVKYISDFIFTNGITAILWANYKFKTTGFSVLEKRKKGKWG